MEQIKEGSYGFTNHNWDINKINLPEADKYYTDLDNITFAPTGNINDFIANMFFDEACQMIANSIQLFQEGFFDAAFYSLRQSIETSIGTLYLTANQDLIKDWNKLKDGFRQNDMVNFLREKEPTFKEIRNKMKNFFEHIRVIQKITNKYVHKQGFLTYYKYQKCIADSQNKVIHNKLLEDFNDTIKAAIGAVAVYRLAIDPLPILLMDEEIMLRSIDLITMPYSEKFVNEYIGNETIEAYKRTEIYNVYRDYIMKYEKQNDAIFNIIHFQCIEISKISEIIKQLYLLPPIDLLAVAFVSTSKKISHVIIDGCHIYTTETKPTHFDDFLLKQFYEKYFNKKKDFNVQFKNGSFISRIKTYDEYSYIESNEPLDENEINGIKEMSKLIEPKYKKSKLEFEELVKKYYKGN